MSGYLPGLLLGCAQLRRCVRNSRERSRWRPRAGLAWLVRDYSMSLGLPAAQSQQLGILQAPSRTLNDSAIEALSQYDDGLGDAGTADAGSSSNSSISGDAQVRALGAAQGRGAT